MWEGGREGGRECDYFLILPHYTQHLGQFNPNLSSSYFISAFSVAFLNYNLYNTICPFSSPLQKCCLQMLFFKI